MGSSRLSRWWTAWCLAHNLLFCASSAVAQTCPALADGSPELYGYKIVAEYPHDPEAFTQGLVYDLKCDEKGDSCREVFWESTGIYGDSSVRVSHLDSGVVEKSVLMDRKWFGEGLAKHKDKLYQITWLTPTGFIYSVPDLKKVGEFKTPLKDGWGITNDGDLLVLSDGSANLTWVDPEKNFQKVKSIEIKAGGKPVRALNELEMINGEIWANIWQTDCIARICPATGAVNGWVLMHGLGESLFKRNLPQSSVMDVLNGIAYDETSKRLFITGKYWPRIFEITVQPINPNTTGNKEKAATCILADGRFGF